MAARLRQIFVLLLSSLQVTFPLLSSAQQQPAAVPAPLQLTLKQTVGLALKQNPQRVIAQLLVSESDRANCSIRLWISTNASGPVVN